MKIFPSFIYQLYIQKRALIVYYSIILFAPMLIIGLVLLTNPGETSGGSAVMISGGIGGATAIMAFVLGCCSFKEPFMLSVQNGISRKTQFSARLLVTAAVCMICALCDEVWTVVYRLVGTGLSVVAGADSLLISLYRPDGNSVLLAIYSVFFTFFLLLAASAAGYFCTVLTYRLNARGKTIFWGSFGLFVSIGGPVLKIIRDLLHLQRQWELLEKAVTGLLGVMFGTPVSWMASWCVIFLLLSLATWPLVRRAQLKR